MKRNGRRAKSTAAKKKRPDKWSVFRGTQTADVARTARGVVSYTPCLGAAIVWSAVPGDPWSSFDELTKARFVSGSTVTHAEIRATNPLDLAGGFLDESFGNLLRKLKYGEKGGITEEEVARVFNYMHNRLIGRAKGGDFNYKVFDEGGDELDPQEVPLSFTSPKTLISEAKESFEFADDDDRLEQADRVVVDAYIFADVPAVQKAADRLGYDAIVYQDVFAGAGPALRDLLNLKPEDVDCLSEMEDALAEEYGDMVWTHESVRPLSGATVDTKWSEPAQRVAADYLKILAERTA